jgi:hypothetical protein
MAEGQTITKVHVSVAREGDFVTRFHKARTEMDRKGCASRVYSILSNRHPARYGSVTIG